MLDYYGTIILNKEDIDKELINSFRKKCYESYINECRDTEMCFQFYILSLHNPSSEKEKLWISKI